MAGCASAGCALTISSGKGLLGLYIVLFSISALFMQVATIYA
jgi:hypothetical protein